MLLYLSKENIFVSALRLWETPVAEYRTVKSPWMRTIPSYQTEVQEWNEEKEKICAGC